MLRRNLTESRVGVDWSDIGKDVSYVAYQAPGQRFRLRRQVRPR